MFQSRNRNSGFTLVEILIVVVILGILAAIVIPQFTDASQNARASSLVSQMQTIRSQLELYQVQHNGQYPDLSADWTRLTRRTNANGDVMPDGGDATLFPFGPYLQHAPYNPYTDAQLVVAVGAGAVTDGWEYVQGTGAISAVGFDEATMTYTAPGGGGGGDPDPAP